MAKQAVKTVLPEVSKSLSTALDFEQDSKQGMENIDRDSLTTPFLLILQSNSPQCDRTQPEYVEKARSGDIMLSTTSELFAPPEGVNIILCYYDRYFSKWLPRTQGGGFKGVITPEEYAKQCAAGSISEQALEKGKVAEVNEEGEIVRDTRAHYILLVRADGSCTPCVITMSSTQIKKSKVWLTLLSSFMADGRDGKYNPPSFAHVFTATTVGESNDQGNWQGWKISRSGFVQDSNIYKAAKEFHDLMRNSQLPVAQTEPAPAGF